jgi:hypothetical protein
MNTPDAAQRLARTVPFDLADIVAYLFLGVGLLIALDISIFGSESFVIFVQGRPLVAATVAGVFGYPTGVTAYGVGRLLRELAKRWKPDSHTRRYLESLVGVRFGSLRKEMGAVVFPGVVSPPGSFMWHARIAIILAEKYLPSAAASIGRQTAFFRFHTTLVGAGSLSALAFGFAAVREATSQNGHHWLVWVAGALGAALVALLSEARVRETNATIARQTVEGALAVAALLKREQHSK